MKPFYISTYRKRTAKDDYTKEHIQYPAIEFIDTEEKLAKIQQETAWGPQVFNGYRNKENFISADILVLDIDDGNLIEFERQVEAFGHKVVITLTTSHKQPGRLDCFRATFFCKKIQNNLEEYAKLLKQLQMKYASVKAEQNPDPVKMFWRSEGGDYIKIIDGSLIELSAEKEIKKESYEVAFQNFKENIPLLTTYLSMSEAELEGKRNSIINKLTFLMASRGYTQEQIINIIYSKQLNRPLDERYKKDVIEYSFNSGRKNHEEAKSNFEVTKAKTIPFGVFFEEFIVLRELSCLPTGMIIMDGESKSDDMVIDQMTVDSLSYKMKGRFKDLASASLNIWKMNQIKKIVKKIESSVEFVEENDSVRRFVKALTGTHNPLDIAVIRHWIWQVKRKFKKKEVRHHLMPILYGKTRSGKSTAIAKLIEPLEHLSMIADLPILNDSRSDFNLVEKLIMFFDELARADKLCVSSLKQKITSKDITYRRLGANQNVVGYNRCSFIGACNESVIDTIIDPTSARRFYEMKTLDMCDWKEINAIDYLALWTGVDENEEVAPIEPHLHELSVSQEKIRAKDFIEEFIELFNYKLVIETNYKFISTQVLYDKMKEWLESQNKGIFLPSLSKFSRKLSNYLDKARTGQQAGFYVNGDSVGGVKVISSNEILSKEN